ncbi:hypothetical protein [uncultured Eubacterium sp.]|uniref:hypothetical protein n=1 Tax=uncultured Eubacterium sp. TaxID=165185 RepID=UPI0025974281|nr:hypothetical protein [uncultured Eubacterium sp.]
MSDLNEKAVEMKAAEDVEVTEVAEMSKLDKAKAGFKKHGKTIGMVVAGVTLGILGYALGSRKSNGGNYDYDENVVDSYCTVEDVDESPVE